MSSVATRSLQEEALIRTMHSVAQPAEEAEEVYLDIGEEACLDAAEDACLNATEEAHLDAAEDAAEEASTQTVQKRQGTV